MLRLSRDKLMEASVIGSGLRQEVLLNEKNLHTINGDNNNNNINGNISWQQLTEMLIYLLSFGANPFDTFQVVRGFGGWRAGTKCYIRMNLLSFARNRNIELYWAVIQIVIIIIMIQLQKDYDYITKNIVTNLSMLSKMNTIWAKVVILFK